MAAKRHEMRSPHFSLNFFLRVKWKTEKGRKKLKYFVGGLQLARRRWQQYIHFDMGRVCLFYGQNVCIYRLEEKKKEEKIPTRAFQTNLIQASSVYIFHPFPPLKIFQGQKRLSKIFENHRSNFSKIKSLPFHSHDPQKQ